MALDISRIPEGYPMGYCDHSDSCDVADCEETGIYEVYFGPWVQGSEEIEGISDGWWIVCERHLRELKGICEVGGYNG